MVQRNILLGKPTVAFCFQMSYTMLTALKGTIWVVWEADPQLRLFAMSPNVPTAPVAASKYPRFLIILSNLSWLPAYALTVLTYYY